MAEQVIAKISADITDLQAKVDTATDLLKRFGKNAAAAGRQSAGGDGLSGITKEIKSTIAAYAGFDVVSGYLTDVKDTAIAYEKALRNVNSITDMSERDLRQFSETVRQLALDSNTGVGATEAMAAAYDIMSNGFTSAADSAKVLESAMKAAAAGNTDTATAAKVLTGALNAYGASADQAAQFTEIMFSAVKDGATTFPELAQYLGQVTSSAATFGVSFEELNAALAVMTVKGINTAQAVTALNQVILQLGNPSKEAEKALDGMGVSADHLARVLKEKGLGAALAELERISGGNARSIASVAGSVDGLKAALSLGGVTLDDFIQKVSDWEKGTSNLDVALRENTGTVEAAQRRWNAAFEDFKIGATEDFLPTAADVLDTITALSRANQGTPMEIGILDRIMGGDGSGDSGFGAWFDKAKRATDEFDRTFNSAVKAGHSFSEAWDMASEAYGAFWNEYDQRKNPGKSGAEQAGQEAKKAAKDLKDAKKELDAAGEDTGGSTGGDDKKQEKEAEKARKEALAQDLHAIELRKRAGELSARQEIEALQRILQTRELAADERRQIEIRIADAEKKIREYGVAQEKKAAEARLDAIEDEWERRRATVGTSIDEEIKHYERLGAAAAKGSKEREDAELRVIELRREQKQSQIDADESAAKAHAKTKDDELQAEIEAEQKRAELYAKGTRERQQHEERVAELKKQKAEEAAEREKQQAEALADLDGELAAEELKKIDDVIEALRKKGAAGEDVEKKLRDAIKERLRLTQRIIDLEAAAAKARADGAAAQQKIDELARQRKADAERDAQKDLDDLAADATKRADATADSVGKVADKYRDVASAARDAAQAVSTFTGEQSSSPSPATSMSTPTSKTPSVPFGGSPEWQSDKDKAKRDAERGPMKDSEKYETAEQAKERAEATRREQEEDRKKRVEEARQRRQQQIDRDAARRRNTPAAERYRQDSARFDDVVNSTEEAAGRGELGTEPTPVPQAAPAATPAPPDPASAAKLDEIQQAVDRVEKATTDSKAGTGSADVVKELQGLRGDLKGLATAIGKLGGKSTVEVTVDPFSSRRAKEEAFTRGQA